MHDLLLISKSELEDLLNKKFEQYLALKPEKIDQCAHSGLISQAELARRLGVTVQTIIRYRRLKRIPFLRIGSSVKFNYEKVIVALEKYRK